jgi:hypothetical protein
VRGHCTGAVVNDSEKKIAVCNRITAIRAFKTRDTRARAVPRDEPLSGGLFGSSAARGGDASSASAALEAMTLDPVRAQSDPR